MTVAFSAFRWCGAKSEWEQIMRREPYINTNEILGELWRENLISSHVRCENIAVAMAT